MYNCRNCGGNLRFDIKSQRLLCPYCSSDYDCYEFEDLNQAARETAYQVTVFSCPQCGGEILSSDESISEFCSYCGASVIFDARLEQHERPQKIIPFQKTEEDCRKAYTSALRKSVFAPSVLKDPRFIEKFRGIYVPYWSYGFRNRGPVHLTSSREYRSGDYDITEYYNVTGEIDAEYDGICYDASSTFDDSISEAIAPFDPGQMKNFVPSYLSGFYADIADVPSDTYIRRANDMANEETLRIIQRDPKAGKYTISDSAGSQTMNRNLSTTVKDPVAALMPVWFLSWRDRDRVAYMTVNGQTGKVAADIPIDVRKYVLAALVAAVPIYFILNYLFSFRPSTTLFLAAVFALVSGIIYYEEAGTIRDKDNRVSDAGYQVRLQKDAAELAKAGEKELRAAEAGQSPKHISNKELGKVTRKPAAGSNTKGKQTKDKKNQPFLRRLIGILSYVSVGLAIVASAVFGLSLSIFGIIFNRFTLNFGLLAASFFLWDMVWDEEEKLAGSLSIRPHKEIMGSQLALIIACLINIWHPVSDVIYYIGMFLAYLGIFATLIRIIQRYNLLITRPVPNFHDRGKEPPL